MSYVALRRSGSRISGPRSQPANKTRNLKASIAKYEKQIDYMTWRLFHASLIPQSHTKRLTRRHLFNYTNNTLFRLKVHKGGIIKAQVNVMNRKRRLSQDNDFWDESKVILCTDCLFLRDIRDKNGNKNGIVLHFRVKSIEQSP